MTHLFRVIGAFSAAFGFAAIMGASSDAYGNWTRYMPAHLCTPINNGLDADNIVYNAGLFNTSNVDAFTVMCPVINDHAGSLGVINAQVYGWDNENNASVKVKACYLDKDSSSAGCGVQVSSLSSTVYDYTLTVDTSVWGLDFNYLSIEVPGKSSSGNSSVDGYRVGFSGDL